MVGRGNLEMNHLTISYVPLAGFLGVAVLLAVAAWREGLLDRDGRFLILLQAGLWASTVHLPDTWHLWINSAPLLLLAGRLAGRVLSRPQTKVFRGAVVLLFSIVVLNGGGRAVAQNISNTRVTRAWIPALREILGDEEFFAFTFLPSFYLELQVVNPYYNSVLYTGHHPEEHFLRNVQILREREPRFILLDYATVEKYGHTTENPVDAHIAGFYQKAFELEHSAGTLEIWERTRP
jgi:hypothetical protein